MKFYRSASIAHAALVGMFFSLVAPALADDPAGHLPRQTLAYVGWDGVLDDSNAGILDAIPAILKLVEEDTGPQGMILRVLPLLDQALRADGAAALLGFAWDRGPMPVFAIVMHGPGRQIMAAVDAMHGDASEDSVGGVVCKHAGDFAWGVHRDTFFFCSRSATEQVIASLVDPGQSLAGTTAFREARDAARIPADPDWHFTVYKNIPQLLQALKTASEDAGDPAPDEFWQVIDELGINQMRQGILHVAPDDKYTATRIFLGYEGTPRGLLKLWQQAAVTGKDLNRVPADAYWASVCNLNLAEVWQEVLRVIEEIEPDLISDIEGGDAMAASMLGFSPTQDLLPIFADTWIWHDAPDNGGLLITGAVLQVETHDAEGLRAIFGRLMQIAAPVAAAQEVSLTVRQADHNGHTIDYLTLPGLPVPIAPAVAFHDGFAVCGLSPQAVKVVLDHLDTPAARGGLASHQDVEEIQARLGGPLQAFYYSDARYTTQMSYGLNLLVQTMATSLAGADIADLPTLPQVLDGMGATVGGCREVDGGVLYESYATGGMPALLPTDLAVVGLLLSILLPSLARARTLAKRAVSASNLRGLGQGFHIYSNENREDFPDSFEELVAAGYVTPDMLVAPEYWEEPTSDAEVAALQARGLLTADNPGSDLLRTSYVLIPGQSQAADVRNVLVYEKRFNEDGANVLFLDGHVQFLPWWEVGQKVRETYQRLGREDEIPAEFR